MLENDAQLDMSTSLLVEARSGHDSQAATSPLVKDACVSPVAGIDPSIWLPRLSWVTPGIRFDTNKPAFLEIKAAGIPQVCIGPVWQAEQSWMRWSIYGNKGYTHIKETRHLTEFWFDQAEGTLEKNHPLFAGLVSKVGKENLLSVAGWAGEPQAYLRMVRIFLWEHLIDHTASWIQDMLASTLDLTGRMESRFKHKIVVSPNGNGSLTNNDVLV